MQEHTDVPAPCMLGIDTTDFGRHMLEHNYLLLPPSGGKKEQILLTQSILIQVDKRHKSSIS